MNTNKEYKDLFIAFLKKRRLYSKYCRYFNDDSIRFRTVKTYKNLNEYLDLKSHTAYVWGTFVWRYTKEGFEYWKKIDIEWVKTYQTKVK